MPFKTPLGGQELPPDKDALKPEEAELLQKIAAKVVRWQMTVPAILFLESVKPLNWIGSQAMVFFEPFVSAIFNVTEYNTFRGMMERRENVERLLQKIEELDAVQMEKEWEIKKAKKAEKKNKHPGFLRRIMGRKKSSDKIPPKNKSN